MQKFKFTLKLAPNVELILEVKTNSSEEACDAARILEDKLGLDSWSTDIDKVRE